MATQQLRISILMAILILSICISTSVQAIKPVPEKEPRRVGDEFAIAIENGDLQKIKALIKEGNKPDTPIEYGNHKTTPLIKASWDGQLEIAKYLVSADTDINFADTTGRTALLQAVFRDRMEIAKFLIDKGARVDVRDRFESTPIGTAAHKGNIDMLKLLIGAKADLASESDGNTPIMLAASGGHIETIEFLVKQGVSVNQTSKQTGRTAIFSAIHLERPDVVRALIRLKANVNVRSKLGETPLKEAMKSKNQNIIEMLRAAGAKD